MRKITFITLVMILWMSSVSFGKENISNLYKWEFSYGIVWKTFGIDSKHVQYVGETKNGLPHGLGYTYFFDKRIIWYFGEWKDGKYHGEGEMNYTDSVFEGEWKEGKIWNGRFYKDGKKQKPTKFIKNGEEISVSEALE